MTDRREFLKKLAKGTAYAAPVIYTMATPRDLMAITPSHAMDMGMGMGMFVAPWTVPPSSTVPTTTAPGSTVPGSSSTGSGN